MKRVVIIICLYTTLMMQIACDNLSDYSTSAGSCYMGNIIDADFVRSGAFDAEVRLTMSLDVDALAKGNENGAIVSTSDGLFDGSPVRQMLEMTRDSLSLIQFPGGRVRSYLAYMPDSSGRIANIVISLMENGDVEVRIFRPSLSAEDALFGVFRLERNDSCNAPALKEIPDASVKDETDS